MERRALLGCGELICDHIFVGKGDDAVYRGSHGGGSVWNTLAEFVACGGRALGCGVGGEDIFGTLAKWELSSLGVATTQIQLQPLKRTQLIFEALSKERRLGKCPPHSFTTRCVICERQPAERARALFDRLDDEYVAFDNVAAICIDRLTKHRRRVVEIAKSHGIPSIADIGHVGFLRYVPGVLILEALSAFDLVMMPAPVARAIFGRVGFTKAAEMMALCSEQILLITNGEDGLRVLRKRDGQSIVDETLAAHSNPACIDSSGAGDAMLARFIARLTSKELLRGSGFRTIGTEELLCSLTEVLGGLGDVLESVGARGHLLEQRAHGVSSEISFLQEHEGKTVAQLRSLTVNERCPFCLNAPETISAAYQHRAPIKAGFRRATAELLRRSIKAVEQHSAIAACREIVEEAKTGYVIGTGGSFPAATYIAMLLNEACNGPFQAIRPFDFLHVKGPADAAVIVTYSGATSDCGLAIQHAHTIGVKRVVLVTGKTNPPLQRLLRPEDISVSHTNNGQERGFISVAGTVAPCVLWATSVLGALPMAKFTRTFGRLSIPQGDIEHIAAALKGGHVIDTFGTGWAWPAMVDLEGKLVEGGLGTAQLHEDKDFSHGRFMLVMSGERAKTAKVLFKCGGYEKYWLQLKRSLEKRSPVIVLESEQEGSLGALEMLMRVQFLCRGISEKMGTDISRPKRIPSDGLELYRWRPGADDVV